MRSLILLTATVLLLLSCQKEKNTENSSSQEVIYFPPVGSTEWQTRTPESLGWNTAALPALYNYLQQQDTRAFLVLKNGKIVLEKYFGENSTGGGAFTQQSVWYWASAGKTLTGFMVGKAQEEGALSINDPSSQYLGDGWTSLPRAKENAITVRHQLTMTTGLDDAAGNTDNTRPQALVYKADASTRWAYHNAPYTLLQKVVANATAQSFAAFFDSRLKNKIGMDGQWVASGDNKVYWSTPRTMARFGILMQAKGFWNGEVILGDTAYYKASLHTSQSLNLSYGYLWWLSGKASHMVPQSPFIFPGSAAPPAPADMVAAMGKDGQLLNMVPSKGLVVVRMGSSNNGGLVALSLQNDIWEKLAAVIR